MREPEAAAGSSWMEEEEDEPRGLSPTRVAVVLLVVIALLVGIGLLATSDNPTESNDQAIPETKNFALTNAEAIAEFKVLRDLGLRATQGRDQSLIDEAFTPGGPLAKRSLRIINELQTDKVIDQIQYRSSSIEVISNEAEIVRLTETRKLFPCFINEQGRDVTEDPSVVDQTVVWTMKLIGTEWRLYDARLLRDRSLKQNANCP